MKICYLTHDINSSAGGGRYASDLIYGIKNSGHEVLILKESSDGFDGIPILKRGYGLFFSALRAWKHLRDCDIIHALDVYPYGIIAYLTNIFLNKRLVITAQGTYSIAPLYHKKTSWLSKKSCRAADIVIAISNFTKKELLKKTTVSKIEVINHGINLRNFYREHKEESERFILGIGSLKSRKGYHISIPAFVLAKKRIPDLKYKIIGSQEDAHYFSKLKSLARDYAVEDDIEFLSRISDEHLSSLYQKARLFILTSINVDHHFEGFGLVFLEAAAAGLPVIGTKGNGIEDAIKDGDNGILVPQNDIEKTATAITSILSDNSRWKNMSNYSYRWAKDHDLQNVIQKYGDTYKKLI